MPPMSDHISHINGSSVNYHRPRLIPQHNHRPPQCQATQILAMQRSPTTVADDHQQQQHHPAQQPVRGGAGFQMLTPYSADCPAGVGVHGGRAASGRAHAHAHAHGGEEDPCEIADRISAMLRQEAGPYRTSRHALPSDANANSSPAAPCKTPGCDGSHSCSSRRPVDPACRTRMAAWSYQIADYCSYRRDVVSQSMNLLDRYLSTPAAARRNAASDRREYQLASMTALYTAVKITEAEVMDPGVVAGLSRGRYSGEDIVETERVMLRAVGFRVTPPTAAAFVGQFLALLRATLLPPPGDSAPATRDIESWGGNSPAALPHPQGAADKLSTLYDLSKYQAELSVLDPSFVGVPPSSIALASVLNAVESVYSSHILLLASNILPQAVGGAGLLSDPLSSVVVESRRILAAAFREHAGYDMLALSPPPSAERQQQPRQEEAMQEEAMSALSVSEPPRENRGYVAVARAQPANEEERQAAAAPPIVVAAAPVTETSSSSACPSRFSALGAVWRSLSGSSSSSSSSRTLSSSSSSSSGSDKSPPAAAIAPIDARLVSESEAHRKIALHAHVQARRQDSTSPRCVSKRKLSEDAV